MKEQQTSNEDDTVLKEDLRDLRAAKAESADDPGTPLSTLLDELLKE